MNPVTSSLSVVKSTDAVLCEGSRSYRELLPESPRQEREASYHSSVWYVDGFNLKLSRHFIFVFSQIAGVSYAV